MGSLDEDNLTPYDYSLSDILNQETTEWSLPETFNWIGCKLFGSCIEQKPLKMGNESKPMSSHEQESSISQSGDSHN